MKNINYTINDKTIKYNYFFVNLNMKQLEYQWWYKWYFNVPNCLSKRLYQLSGTCWLNSILNTIISNNIIVDNIKNRINHLLRKYDLDILYDIKYVINDDDIKTFKNIDSKKKKKKFINKYLVILFNYIVNKNNKIDDNNDYVIRIAYMINCLYTNTFCDFDEVMKNQGIGMGKDEQGHVLHHIMKLFKLHKNNDIFYQKDNITVYNNMDFINEKKGYELVSFTFSYGTLNDHYEDNGHLIACIKCDDEKYIYDPFNYLSKVDWSDINNILNFINYSIKLFDDSFAVIYRYNITCPIWIKK